MLVEGEATVTADEEAVDLHPGDAIHIAPDATHQIKKGDTETPFVLVGAP
nr:cupin domain-containing protein [Halorientalis pallida]